jgi:hypothetical protein
MKKGFSILLSIFFVSNLFSQEIKNVDFTIKEDQILIKYDLLNCPSDTKYDLNIFFVKKDGSQIKPITLTGDVLNVLPGENKQIIWMYKNETDDYEGELKLVVSILQSHSINANNQNNSEVLKSNDYNYNIPEETPRVKGGGGNAVLSAILPGLGDHFVNKSDHFTPILVSLAYLGAGYVSYDALQQANTFYDTYLQVKTQSLMDENYAKAMEFKTKHETFFAAAAAIWLFDVIHVSVKGIKNTKYNKSTSKIHIYPTYKMYNAALPMQLSLIKSF